MPDPTISIPQKILMPGSRGQALFARALLLSCVAMPLTAPMTGQMAPRPAAVDSQGQTCTALLQKQDAGAVAACKAQVDDAEKAPLTERMARIVAHDEYGLALLAVGHKPRLALEAFDRSIALLPGSTVKPDSLQWAVAFWHRATAYQQLLQWDHAANDLATAEGTLTKAIAAATGNQTTAQHFTQLRQRVRTQRAQMLEHLAKRSEAQKILATQ